MGFPYDTEPADKRPAHRRGSNLCYTHLTMALKGYCVTALVTMTLNTFETLNNYSTVCDIMAAIDTVIKKEKNFSNFNYDYSVSTGAKN